jgi:CheY-like chemotaxis protein
MIANKTAVLYVDDNSKSGRLLATVFRICGCRVVTAADPVETLRHSRRLCFDLVLLDYHLPVLSGSELAQKIKSMHSGIPIVTISSCAVLRDIELLFVDGSSLADLLAARTLTCYRAVERNKAIVHDWSDST